MSIDPALSAAELRQRAEVQPRSDEPDRFNRAMIDRELRVLELKSEVNALHAGLGETLRYNPQATPTTTMTGR